MEAPERLRRSLDDALGFMAASVNDDGLWSDFSTLAGESVYWVSGYVGYAIAQSEAMREELAKVSSRLLERQAEDGGWGYGPGVPSDADSTSWCVLFLSKLGTLSDESRWKAVRFLLEHQSPLDGGFRTYARPSEVGRFMMLDASVSFEGWSSSQMCVTPVAAGALAEAGCPDGLERALQFAREGQTIEGYWEPYWWSERLYATVNCIEFLRARGSVEDSALVTKAQDWISRTQLLSGAWSDVPGSEGVPFSTALALKGVLAGARPELAESAGRGVEWLLAEQLADGSWNSHHILRIPHPASKEPWKQPLWNRDGKAIGAVIKDQRRLYTTATVFTALLEFEKRLSSGEA